MDFNPPVIRHLDDVLPFIDGKNEIVHIVKEDYSVLDYVYVLAETFDNEFAKECRGLKFDRDGKLIARPYHKFHNLGENKEYGTTRVDLSKPHDILDKLDGSMVHNATLLKTNSKGVNYRVHALMTRKGESEVALAAKAWLFDDSQCDAGITDAHTKMWEKHPEITFIYEYVGPTNKIVVEYDEENLILTGARYIETGEYLYYPFLKDLAKHYGIPIVGAYPVDPEWKVVPEELYESIKLASGNEGAIIRFSTGAMVKIKADEYVRKHRSKDLVAKFKDLIELIVNDQLDDVIPQLDEPLQEKIFDYNIALWEAVDEVSEALKAIVTDAKEWDQKAFALEVQKNFPKSVFNYVPGLLFSSRKTEDYATEIKRCIQRNTSDTKRLTALFEELQLPIWEGDFFSE